MRAEAIPNVKSSSTIRTAMRAGRETLDSSDTPDLDSQVLLAHFLGVDRAFLFAHPERTLSDLECAAFLDTIHRRAAGEPIAYITGAKGFYDIDLQVTPSVLIPRPETELLLEEALRLSEDRPDLCVADIGTGSGALAIAFARQRPAARVYATDVCADALAVARENAALNGADVSFLEGDLAEPVTRAQNSGRPAAGESALCRFGNGWIRWRSVALSRAWHSMAGLTDWRSSHSPAANADSVGLPPGRYCAAGNRRRPRRVGRALGGGALATNLQSLRNSAGLRWLGSHRPFSSMGCRNAESRLTSSSAMISSSSIMAPLGLARRRSSRNTKPGSSSSSASQSTSSCGGERD